MVIESRLLAAALLVFGSIATACHRSAPPEAIDPSLASCVPPGAMILAGVDLDQLRSSQLYRKLSPATAAFAEPLRNASQMLLTSSGADLTVIARGSFREPPAGSEWIAPNLVVMGSADTIRAARAQYRNSTTGAPDLLSYAQPLAAQNPVWAVARGAVTLPLTGNLANLNRFLHSTEYTTAAARITDILSLNIAGICRTPNDAQHLERTLRAFLSLATLRSPGTSRRSTITLDDRTVRLTLTADAVDAEKLLH